MVFYKDGYRVVISRDYDAAINPRELTCYTKIIAFHKKYNLGDKHDFKLPSEFDEWIIKNEKELALIKPVYMYDHSGLSFSITPFSCPFDSGQIGYIYLTKENVKECFGTDDVAEDKILELFNKELSHYQTFANGEQVFYQYDIYNSYGDKVDYFKGFELIEKDFKQLIDHMLEYVEKPYRYLFEEIKEQKHIELEQE